MKIKLIEAVEIVEKYGLDQAPIIFLKSTYLYTGSKIVHIHQGTKFNSEHAAMFKKAEINEIDVAYNDKLLVALIKNFPTEYRLPTQSCSSDRKSLYEFDKLIEEVEMSNSFSKHKRHIISCVEFYEKVKSSNLFEPFVEYNSYINQKKWQSIKPKLKSQNKILKYRFSESGIIILIPTTGDISDNEKQRRINIQVNIHSMILTHRKSSNFTISNDFLPDRDTYILNDPESLVDVYNQTIAAMIVYPQFIENECINSFKALKKFDKYAKILPLPPITKANYTDLLQKIKTVYNSHLWKTNIGNY